MQEKELVRLRELTLRYIHGTITAEEQAELDIWLDKHPMNRERFLTRVDPDKTWQALVAMERGELVRETRQDEMAQHFQEQLPSIAPKRRHTRRWVAASAAAVLLVATAAWLLTTWGNHSQGPVAKQPVILPGGNKAILQLSDGRKIDLTSAAKGPLAQQGSSQVIKEDSGQLSYFHMKSISTTIAYNMVLTPKGGTYRVTLPDNTNVWLNAESSIRFPTSFTGAERRVQVTGEAYFEVSKNEAMPFIAEANGMSIRVLGTHFDMRSYADEQVKRATLLEGSIVLQAGGDLVVLKPGEQGAVTSHINVAVVDTDETVAWKDGYFVFNKAHVETIMREISRWFNVQVVYEGEKTDRKLTGRVSRLTDASKILEILEANGYHVSITPDGKTITILP